MLNFITFADLHGKLPQIPKKDRNRNTYIILAGDIAPNNVDNFKPCIKEGRNIKACGWDERWNYRQIDRVAEGDYQSVWSATILVPHLLKNNIDLNKVIWINGNHDFIPSLEGVFPNSLSTGSKVINIEGLKVGLLVGVNPLVGEWHDEISDYEFRQRIHAIDPEIDMLISHSPPYGVMDNAHGEPHIGNQELYTSIFGRSVFDSQPPYFSKLKYHVFGHAHGNHGVVKEEIGGRKLKLYNTAKHRFTISI